jgi:hypothetical protein
MLWHVLVDEVCVRKARLLTTQKSAPTQNRHSNE